MNISRLFAIFAAWFLLSAQAARTVDLDAEFEKTVLIVSATEYACHLFDIYLAMTTDQQRQGLMFVREMPGSSGMLFPYRQAGIRSMWMKNTYIPLDILFIKANGTVSSIAKHTEPHSLASISAIEPVNYVLELNAGITERLRIDSDSSVIFPSSE